MRPYLSSLKLAGLILLLWQTRVYAEPGIEFTYIPGSVASGYSYDIHARGWDANGRLTKVNIWRNSAPLAFAGPNNWGGSGSEGTSEGSSTDHVPEGPSNATTVTFEAQAEAEDEDGNTLYSDRISRTVTIYRIQMSEPYITNDPSSLWINALTTFAPSMQAAWNGGGQLVWCVPGQIGWQTSAWLPPYAAYWTFRVAQRCTQDYEGNIPDDGTNGRMMLAQQVYPLNVIKISQGTPISFSFMSNGASVTPPFTYGTALEITPQGGNGGGAMHWVQAPPGGIPSAGTYTISAYRDGDGNYNPTSTNPPASTSFTITKANQTLTSLTTSPASPVSYGTTVTLTPSEGAGTGKFSWTGSGPGLSETVETPEAGSSIRSLTRTFYNSGSYTYTVKKLGDINYNESNQLSVSITVNPQLYTLTVGGGTGSGSYTAGTNVAVSANSINGYVFTNWTVSGPGTLANANASSTTFTMGAGAAALTPHFVPATYSLTVVNGTGSGSYTAGSTPTISAAAPPAGQLFSNWALASGVGSFANPTSATTTFTMSASNSVVQPVYYSPAPPVLVGLHAAGFGVTTSLSLDSWQTGYGHLTNTVTGQGTSNWTAAHQYRTVVPGLDYMVQVSGSSQRELRFEVPKGYTLFIDDAPYADATTINLDNYRGGSVSSVHFFLVANDGSAALRAGYAIDPQLSSDDVIWAISMGRAGTGRSVGALTLRKTNVTGQPFSLDLLTITNPDIDGVLATYSDAQYGGPWGYARRFYYAPGNCWLWLDDHVPGFPTTYSEIKAYEPNADPVWDASRGTYKFINGGAEVSPFACYVVSSNAPTNDTITITKNKGNAQETTWTLKKTANGTNTEWLLKNGTQQALRTVSTVSGANTTEEVTVEDGSGNVAQRFRRTYQDFGWGKKELISEANDPNGLNLVTSYTYGTSGASFGKLLTVSNPDGTYTKYDYAADDAGYGKLWHVYTRWLDVSSSAATANASNAQTITFTYSPVWSYLLDPVNVTSSTVPVGGAPVMVTKLEQNPNYTSTTFNGKRARKDMIRNYYGSGASDYLSSTRITYHPEVTSDDFANRLISETGANGAKRSVIFYKGHFTDNGDANSTLFQVNANSALNTQWGEYTFYGFSTAVSGSQLVTTFDNQPVDPLYMVPNRSFVDLTVMENGRIINAVRYIFTGASSGSPSFEFIGSSAHGYVFNNSNGTATDTVTDHRGTRIEQFFTNGQLTRQVGNDGIEVSYQYNTLGWAVRKDLAGAAASGNYAAQGAVYTHYNYDSAGRELSRKVSSSTDSTQPGPQNSYHYDSAGRLDYEVDASGLQTSYSYNLSAHTITVTYPGGATKIVETYADGSLKSITGTAVTPEYYTAAVATDGAVTRTVYALRASDFGNPTAAPRWVNSTSDWLGRVTREESPSPIGGTIATTYAYNAKGQVTTIKTVDSATGTRLVADSLTEYNTYEVAYRSGMDLDGSGALEPGSASDRITESDAICEKDGNGTWWLKTTSKLYNQAGNATPITSGVIKQRLHKLSAAGANVQSDMVAIDLLGNQTHETISVDRTSRLVTSTVDVPDSSADSVTVMRNGLLVRKQTTATHVATYAYDALRRLVCTSVPRVDGSTLAQDLPPRIGYNDGTAAAGSRYQIAWSKDTAGSQSNFTYSSTNGLLAAVQDPSVGGQGGKYTYYDYTTRGELYRQWGHVPYPSETGFNDYGEAVSLKTFRGGDPATWNQSSWPATVPAADLTKWIYDTATGLLLEKYDAANLDSSGQAIANAKKVSYTYNKLGQVKTRTWARGVVTTYKYYGEDVGDPLTAELKSIDYGNTTASPDVSYAFNRHGAPTSIGDATGTRSLAYNPTTALLQSETLPALLGSRIRTPKYETATAGALGRITGFSLGVSGNATGDYDVTYGYDGFGRPNSVTTGGVSFDYGYVAGSNLIASINETTSGWSQMRAWVSNRNLLDKIETKVGTTSKAAYQYGYDELGRRTSVIQTGELFNRYVGQGIVTKWAYNDRSEVVSSRSYHGQTLGDVSYPVAGRGYGFDFDSLGNRVKSSVDDRETTYSVNNLNQLKARTTPGKVEVSGLAPTASTVQANGQNVTRQGDYYHKPVDVNNTNSAVNTSVAVTSTTPSTSTTRKAFVPKATLNGAEQWQYDDDGNLTRDDQWSYTWDAENRLVAIETRSDIIGTVITALDARRLEFTYDYLGRRVRKLVRSGWNGSTFSSTADLDRRFIYNGWSLAGEYEALSTFTLKRTFTWGLDFSGSADGAGGAGGLLMSREGATDYVYAYDGKGNITSVINRTAGTTVAEYEYSPFGEQIRATGSYAQLNPFRFSTQYFDIETNLVCYHRRYYDPKTGRWLSRDPIEEAGGLNMYGFVGNSPMNRWDVRGMGWPSWFGDASRDADNHGYGGCGFGGFGGRFGGGGGVVIIVTPPTTNNNGNNGNTGTNPGGATGTGSGPTGPAVGPIGNSGPSVIAPPDTTSLPPTTSPGTYTPPNPTTPGVVAATNATISVPGGDPAGPNPPGTTATTTGVGSTTVVGTPTPTSPTPTVGSIPSPVTTPSPADNRIRHQVGSGATGRYSPDALDVAADASRAALKGAADYSVGLLKGAWGAVTGTVHAIAHPVDTITGTADALGTLAGRAIYDTEGLASDVKARATEIVTNPGELGNAVGNVVGGAAIGAGTARVLRAIGEGGEVAANVKPTGQIDDMCFVAGTVVATATGSRPIEELAVGDRVLTYEQNAGGSEVDPATWQKITLTMPDPENASVAVKVQLLRSPEWMAEVGCGDGARIWLSFDEMGLHGAADVMEVVSCPPIQPGPGRVVLATVTRLSSSVQKLRLAGGDETLQLTGSHPLFSVTRNGWVAAENLHLGEELATMAGSGWVESIVALPGVHRVYNIEVEADHCYYAGTEQVLSHNSCGAGGAQNAGRAGKQARLRELAEDPNVSSADRGWIKQEINSIERGQRDTIRNPPGKDLAHERGREAAKDYSYEHSNLQDRDLHRTQHKYDDFGRANPERPLRPDEL
jgi:RHS repeat-associated protein